MYTSIILRNLTQVACQRFYSQCPNLTVIQSFGIIEEFRVLKAQTYCRHLGDAIYTWQLDKVISSVLVTEIVSQTHRFIPTMPSTLKDRCGIRIVSVMR